MGSEYGGARSPSQSEGSSSGSSSRTSNIKPDLLAMDVDSILQSRQTVKLGITSPSPSAVTSPSYGSRHAGGADPSSKPAATHKTVSHLPRAESLALKEFTPLETNTHQYKALGRHKQEEDSMICDCWYRPSQDEPYLACGEGSDCINRLTMVECLPEECKSRQHCKNQRFTNKEYADIEVIQTEKKGYGLRAGSDIAKESFIYEYIGEVVSEPTFKKRMQEYHDEGIEHFYFMMLQKDEFLDATRKGCIARFANHSCNPNCYVAKWTVGKRVRMGIFAKRAIDKGEEITFNYNVDRYGHDAQTCYCDEPNCVGSIGGKTQTDVAGMDDLYLDALGITDEVQILGLKGNKRGKKSKKLGEDFFPDLKPLEEDEVQKVVAAVKQSTGNQPMLSKLLERVKMTENPQVGKRFVVLRGIDTMVGILKEYVDEDEVVRLVLEVLTVWIPALTNRNKVEDAKAELHLQPLVEHEESNIKKLSAYLITEWAKLPSVYRIPKRPVKIRDEEDDAPDASPVPQPSTSSAPTYVQHESLFNNHEKFDVSSIKIPTPLRAPITKRPPLKSESSATASPAPKEQSEAEKRRLKLEREQRIIEQAEQQAAEKVRQKREAEELAEAEARQKEEQERQAKRDKKKKGPSQSSILKHVDPEAKDKKLLKLIGEVVVKSMSKYKSEFETEKFKKYAKECANVLVEKEKKSLSYIESSNVNLSEEKQAKMKQFAKDFINKVRSRHKNKASTPASSSTPVSGTFPPNIEEPQTKANGSESSTTTFSKTPLDEEFGGSPAIVYDVESSNILAGTRRPAEEVDDDNEDSREKKRGKTEDGAVGSGGPRCI